MISWSILRSRASARGRQSRNCQRRYGGISKSSSGRTSAPVNVLTLCFFALATQRRSTKRVVSPRLASCYRTHCISIGSPWTGWNPSSAFTRGALGRTWEKWRGQTSSSCIDSPGRYRTCSTQRSIPTRTRAFCALKVSLRSLQLDCYDYAASPNPPILHRKETFIPEDYPGYLTFKALTVEEEEHGLLSETARIGTREGWEECLREVGVRIEEHRLVPL